MNMSDKTLSIFAEEYSYRNNIDIFDFDENNKNETKELLDKITEFARREGYIVIRQLNIDGCFIELTERGKEFVRNKLIHRGFKEK